MGKTFIGFFATILIDERPYAIRRVLWLFPADAFSMIEKRTAVIIQETGIAVKVWFPLCKQIFEPCQIYSR
ncbi:hypothetical protein DB728_35695 [Rhizobium leguminosarum bv. viciae USDA 2370]|nr:hypothetical protein BS629_14345 [Rhizobium leguminosarum bv. viciae USDA 2370]PUB60029.1 hypothetical protein DB728_35695 [Rhizobium leguminosarum bv. viciae USDA 2370]